MLLHHVNCHEGCGRHWQCCDRMCNSSEFGIWLSNKRILVEEIMFTEFFTKLISCVKHISRCNFDACMWPMSTFMLIVLWKCWLSVLAHDDLTVGRVGLVDVSPLPCLRCFHGGRRCPQGAHRRRGAILWVARHDSQAGESFCSGERPVFVNTWAYTYILYSCVSPVRRVLFVCTCTLNLFMHPNVDTNVVLIIYSIDNL